jgi:hypothetical protein
MSILSIVLREVIENSDYLDKNHKLVSEKIMSKEQRYENAMRAIFGDHVNYNPGKRGPKEKDDKVFVDLIHKGIIDGTFVDKQHGAKEIVKKFMLQKNDRGIVIKNKHGASIRSTTKRLVQKYTDKYEPTEYKNNGIDLVKDAEEYNVFEDYKKDVQQIDQITRDFIQSHSLFFLY